MSKSNALLGLIGNYGDSDSDEESNSRKHITENNTEQNTTVRAGIHPAPISHCPWSACYDDSSGFTYYWNHKTNAVTWEAPPEYLLALKVAQQQLNASRSTEVSAEEWKLYQKALVQKKTLQSKPILKTLPTKQLKPNNKLGNINKINTGKPTKRRLSDDEVVKIELITSYHNSDSDSNDEVESPVKTQPQPPKILNAAPPPPKVAKNVTKKQKAKQVVEYGPLLPSNQTYTVPIGPELPPHLKETKPPNVVAADDIAKVSSSIVDIDDSQDESSLLKKLKDKAKLLEKLGGEIPKDLKNIIKDGNESRSNSPGKINDDTSQESKSVEMNIDDLLNEIEKKELPKIIQSRTKLDVLGHSVNSTVSGTNSPKNSDDNLEVKALFPSSKFIVDESVCLFPSVTTVNGNTETGAKELVQEQKKINQYLYSENDSVVITGRKKLRIDNSLLPERKNSEVPAYTTKYAQGVEGFTGERTGLGFSKEHDDSPTSKPTISYGNGLTFTKGEVLNEDKQDEDLDDLTDLVEAKLKFLNNLQPCNITSVQEMLVQMQTLCAARREGALCGRYWRRWADGAASALSALEAAAAPAGWSCRFLRSEGKYQYQRESDGLTQWEYPAVIDTDMELCTTPPPPPDEPKEEPPLPPSPPPPPPPPRWHEPPPPGCDEPAIIIEEPKKIGDELMSFYNDIAELEKQSTVAPPPPPPSPPPPPPPPEIKVDDIPKENPQDKLKDKTKEKPQDSYRDLYAKPQESYDKPKNHIPDEKITETAEKAKDIGKVSKKKSKVKISSSIGMKHKTVSSMVAKWQQVAEQIDSD